MNGLVIPDFVKGKVRALIRRIRRPGDIGDASRSEPLSRKFGFDRGLPIDRYYVERFCEGQGHRMTGDLLEIAETRYTRKFAPGAKSHNIISVDPSVVESDGPTGRVMIADLRDHESLPEDEFDGFLQTQILNFVDDPEAVLVGSMRVVRPGGWILGTVSSISQVSTFDNDRWGDFWRFTPRGLAELVRRATDQKAEVTVFGNFAAARAFLDGMATEEFPSPELLDQPDPQYPVLLGYAFQKPV